MWEACLELEPQASFSSTYRWHFDLQVSPALISFCVTSGEAQAEKRVGKCAAQWTCIASTPGPPASCTPPQVPLGSFWLQQLPLSWWEQQRFVSLLLNFIQVDIYTAHAQCILWFFYSVSCLQSVFRECRSVSMYCLCQCFLFPLLSSFIVWLSHSLFTHFL